MYIWNIELVIRSEMCHSLYIGEDGQLQFAPHALRGLTWLADAHELLRVAGNREYLEITVVRPAVEPARLEATWAGTWHDVLVVVPGHVCFGPRDEDGWRWAITGELRARFTLDGWELERLGEDLTRFASWDELAAEL